MDGKSISNIANSFPVLKTKTKNEVKSQSSHQDRDADGRRSPEQDSRRELTQDEIEKALKLIKELPGFKKNNLKVRIEVKEKSKVVYIEDQLGKVIRRINESELCQFLDKGPEQKGQIYSRSA